MKIKKIINAIDKKSIFDDIVQIFKILKEEGLFYQNKNQTMLFTSFSEEICEK